MRRTWMFISAATLAALATALAPASALADTPAARADSQVVVKFDPSATQTQRNAALAGVAGKVVRSIPQIGYVVVQLPKGKSNDAAADRLDDSKAVDVAEPDSLTAAALVPNDPLFPLQWGWENQQAQAAWDVTTGSSSTVVAVLDTGVNASHPDLAGGVTSGYDFVNNDANAADDYGHGTAVAGIIGARAGNGIGIAGWCSACTILPVKVLGSNGSGSSSGVAQGIVWAVDHGADILNLSLAGGNDPAEGAAVTYAVNHGATVVASAG